MFRIGILALALLAATPTPALGMKTWPAHQAFAPSDIRVEVRVPRHADNRLLIVAAFDGEMEAARSEAQLEGAQSRVLFVFAWPQMPAGDYAVIAVVLNGLGQERGRVAQAIRLMDRAQP